MTEIYANISDQMKSVAETAWRIAMSKKNPVEAAQFLDDITNFYRNLRYSPEEIKFLQFYFNMKMETYKNG